MNRINLISRNLILMLFLLALLSCNQQSNKESTDVAKNHPAVAADSKEYKHWVWIGPDEKERDEELHERYKKYKEAGIVGIFFESDSKRHFKIAKEEGLQAHRWLWIMNRGDALAKHPEWAAISRSGQSCADNPPYVGYYKWMCPSKPEVLDFLVSDVQNMLSKDYVDGIHFDYIRYSDVVLASNLWKVYDIVQTEELPEYDFCYCQNCKAKFKKAHGKDIDEMEYPQASLSWRDFRYGQVSYIADSLAAIAHSYNKPVTAAVFPTPDVAKKLVFQDWTNWHLDAVFPMIYHGFYEENVPWIGSAVQQGLRGLDGRFPLYAGLYLPDFNNMQEVEQGVKYALENGASGISIFGNLDDEVLQILARNKLKSNN